MFFQCYEFIKKDINWFWNKFRLYCVGSPFSWPCTSVALIHDSGTIYTDQSLNCTVLFPTQTSNRPMPTYQLINQSINQSISITPVDDYLFLEVLCDVIWALNIIYLQMFSNSLLCVGDSSWFPVFGAVLSGPGSAWERVGAVSVGLLLSLRLQNRRHFLLIKNSL